jgi:hypothetical protein
MNSMEQEFQILAVRIDRLERQNGRWKKAAVLLGLLSATLMLMAGRAADRVESNVIHARTVEAQDFVVKDQHGQIRARLSLYPFSVIQANHSGNFGVPPGPTLQFYDEGGDPIWTAPQNPTMIPAR